MDTRLSKVLSLPPSAALAFFHARTKHIEVDYHFVQEKVLNHEISIKLISTKDQVADVFTKALSSAPFHFSQIQAAGDFFSHQLAGDVSLPPSAARAVQQLMKLKIQP